MNPKFSANFTSDKADPGIPLYTGCVAVKLYEVMYTCKIIRGGDKDFAAYNRVCNRTKGPKAITKVEYPIPNDYSVPDGDKHCLRREYWYISYAYLVKDSPIKTLCNIANCGEGTNIERVHREIENMGLFLGMKRDNSYALSDRNSTRYNS